MSKKLFTPGFGPLKGLRVVFSAIEVAGPYSAQMLAEWGAEVIWIEHSAYGDTIRVQPNYPEMSRRNLHAMAINIFSDEGKEAFLKLIETADIFIEASKGPAFARRGITDELLWEHNRKLVIAHLSGFGQFGVDEYTNSAAYNTIAQAFSGYLIQNGDVDQPMPAFPYTADYISGFAVTSSVLAALHNVHKTGVGESIDVAMYEVMLHVGQYYMMDYLNGGEMCPRMTRGKDPLYVGCGVYKCRDGYVVMELVGAKPIEKMFPAIGIGHLLGTEEFPEGIQLISRKSPSAQLVEDHLDEFLAGKTIAEAQAIYGEYGIAFSKVLDIPELESHPQYVARNSFIEWETPSGKVYKGPNIMPRFKNNPCKVWRGMPTHGMDTASILNDIGYSDEAIQAMADKGVVKLGIAPAGE